MPGILQDAKDTDVTQTDKNLYPFGLCSKMLLS